MNPWSLVIVGGLGYYLYTHGAFAQLGIGQPRSGDIPLPSRGGTTPVGSPGASSTPPAQAPASSSRDAAIAAARSAAAAESGYAAASFAVANVQAVSVPVALFSSGCPPTMDEYRRLSAAVPSVDAFSVSLERSLATPELPYASTGFDCISDGIRVVKPCVYGL